ncbi:MAG: hypothetical protein QXY49_07375, partial [Thermofilaceae archaeon]
LIMLSSPQLPLTTLRELKKVGFDYLPDPEELISGYAKLNWLSERMKKILDGAIKAQLSGNRNSLEEKLKDILAELSTTLETTDHNISNLYSLVSTFTSTVPVTIVATQALLGGGGTATALSMAFIGLIIAMLVGFWAFPWEFGISTPKLQTYALLLLIMPSYLLFNCFSIPNPFLLSLALGSAPSAAFHLHHTLSELKKMDKSRELIRVAARAIGNPYLALAREKLLKDPEELLNQEWKGFSKAATLGLWQVLLHGGYENLQKLDDYVSKVLEFTKRLRSKTRIFLVYAIIEAAIVAAIYAVILGIEPLFTEGGEWMIKAGISILGLRELRENIDQILSLNALTLAVATASAREGRPHLLTMYLPLIAGIVWFFWLISSTLTPLLVGG